MRSKRNDCEQFRLDDAVLQTLGPDDESRLANHLNDCLSCREKMAQFAGEESFWSKATSNLASSAEFQSAPEVAVHSSVFVRIDPEAPSIAAVSTTESFESIELESKLPFDPPTHPEMLGRVEGFSIEQMIGRGGMGVVYKGFDAELNRPVAIKFLAPHLSVSGVARKRFAREAQAAAAVVHPNVVPIYSIGTSQKRPFIVMALVSGRSLQKHVEDHGPLPAEDVVRIAQQISAGLSAAHEQGLVHRDIKPANIMLEKEVSRVLITDFGLARASDDASMTQSGWLAGTPHYMSPEQTKGDEIAHSSDLFSLGSVMYFMATGREPFRSENPYGVLQKIGSEMPASARAVNSAVPLTLDEVIEKLHAKDPSQRFETASAVQEILTQYLAHLQNPTQHPKPLVNKTSQKNRLLPKVMLGLAVGIVACIAAYPLGAKFFPSGTIAKPKPQPTVAHESTPEPPPAVTPDWISESSESQRWTSTMSQLRQSVDRMQQPVQSSPPSDDIFERRKIELRQRIDSVKQSFGI